MAERLYLYDTTLRDGQQTQGVQFSTAEKQVIAAALDDREAQPNAKVPALEDLEDDWNFDEAVQDDAALAMALQMQKNIAARPMRFHCVMASLASSSSTAVPISI